MAITKGAELPIAERDRRYVVIRGEMKKRGLDCLIMWGNGGHFDARTANIRYVSQIGGGSTDAYAIFPLDGEPTVITWGGGALMEEWVRSQSWVTDIRPRRPSYTKHIIDRITELNLKTGTFGLVATMTNYHMPYPDYLQLTQAFPDATFEDATAMMDEIRSVKSPIELQVVETASEIGDRAIDAMYATAKPGIREDAVFARMVYTMLLEDGAEIPSMFLWDCGQPQRALRLTQTQGKILQRGDVIQTEFSPRYRGYYAHFSWPCVVGRNTVYEDLFAAAQASYFAGLKMLKPGISGEDLRNAFNTPVEEHGYVWGLPQRAPYFHGIGLAWDPPRATTKVIDAGMCVGVETGAGTLDGKHGIHIGDVVVVTENGCRRLGRHPIELVSV